MGRFITVLGCALVLGSGSALAQPTKTVTGTITSIAADAVTVKAGGQDMTFAVDSKTRVIAPGAGTKGRAAEAQGKAGASVTGLLKTGQAVEVRYHEQGMHAASIRTIGMLPAPKAHTATKAQTAAGIVSSVNGNSLTVKGGGGEWTFSVDEKTTVSGTGLGTAQRKLMSEGGKPTLSEFVHEGDTVTVTYHDMDTTKHASVIRITRRKM